ncbi:MAG: terpene cyclase/mutase family protein [Planctomycetota bacterium]|jgi:hypothetical protein|nr:terpene cyclase/mutase family protein [Planctomycetota bacterium]
MNGILILVLTPLLLIQDPPIQPIQAEITPQARSTIEKGLVWLHRNQARSGAYGNGSAPVATTAIVGMAFLAGGHLPGRSKYGENILDAVRFLLKMTSRKGYINEGQARGMGGSGMHGHGYAVLFLAEVYGMCSGIEGFKNDNLEEELKEKLTQAIRIIENSQCANGGWNYEPNPTYDEGSVTITQIQALRASRNAGIRVNRDRILKAVEYINKSTNGSGLTRYSLTSGGHTSFALTAAGMSSMNFLGDYNNPKVKKGLDYLLRSLPGKGKNMSNMGAWGGWYFYGNYYATLAMYQAKEDSYWEKWYPAIREDLIRTQASNGSWTTAESSTYGAAFGTGFALQILQVPNRYLPIYQNGKD